MTAEKEISSKYFFKEHYAAKYKQNDLHRKKKINILKDF